MKIDISFLKLYLKLLFIAALFPLGIGTSFPLANSAALDGSTRKWIMFSAIFLMVVSSIIINILVVVSAKKYGIKKNTYYQWISIISWLPVGIIPGFAGFGWKYAVCITVLPCITIYHFFQWIEKMAINGNGNK